MAARQWRLLQPIESRCLKCHRRPRCAVDDLRTLTGICRRMNSVPPQLCRATDETVRWLPAVKISQPQRLRCRTKYRSKFLFEPGRAETLAPIKSANQERCGFRTPRAGEQDPADRRCRLRMEAAGHDRTPLLGLPETGAAVPQTWPSDVRESAD